jgi:hypothetical protein
VDGIDQEGAPVKVAALLITLAIASTGVVSPPRDAPGQAPQFRGRTDVVSVPVSVTRGRNPVTGLTAADFELEDNGVRQVIDAVSLEQIPIDVTFLLTQFSPERDREFVRTLEGAGATRAQLRSGDRLRLVLADDGVTGRLLDANASLAIVPEVRDLQTGVGFAGGFRSGGTDGTRGLQTYGFGVPLADALFYALAWPSGADRRHVIAAFTDGHNTIASVLDMEMLPRIAARSDAVLHAVLWAAPGEGGSSGGLWRSGPVPRIDRAWEASFRALDETVQRTGGTLQRTHNAVEALTEIITNFRSSYVLRYTPPEAPKPGWHEIRVKMTRPGSFNIRARRGYEVGSSR